MLEYVNHFVSDDHPHTHLFELSDPPGCIIYRTDTMQQAACSPRLGQQIKRQLPGLEIREVDRAIVFPGGGETQIRSAEDPDSLVSEGLDRAIFDETGIIQERAWIESIAPALVEMIRF